MITSLLTRKISMSLLNKGFLIVANKIGDIVKVFDIVSSIPFRSIPYSLNKLFNYATLVFLYSLFVKQTVYLKGFGNTVSLSTNTAGVCDHMRTRAMKRIIG